MSDRLGDAAATIDTYLTDQPELCLNRDLFGPRPLAVSARYLCLRGVAHEFGHLTAFNADGENMVHEIDGSVCRFDGFGQIKETSSEVKNWWHECRLTPENMHRSAKLRKNPGELDESERGLLEYLQLAPECWARGFMMLLALHRNGEPLADALSDVMNHPLHGIYQEYWRNFLSITTLGENVGLGQVLLEALDQIH